MRTAGDGVVMVTGEEKYTRRDFLRLAVAGMLVVVTPAGVFVRGGVRCWRRCGACGAVVVRAHEFEGHEYCPNCGVVWGQGEYHLPDGGEQVGRWGGVAFPDPGMVRETSKPVWRMRDMAL